MKNITHSTSLNYIIGGSCQCLDRDLFISSLSYNVDNPQDCYNKCCEKQREFAYMMDHIIGSIEPCESNQQNSKEIQAFKNFFSTSHSSCASSTFKT